MRTYHEEDINAACRIRTICHILTRPPRLG